MELLCRAYGSPQFAYPVIHVAGTNGKGSVVAMLESIFRQSGIRCAAFTSPHLVAFNERIRIDGQAISDVDLLTRVNELECHLNDLKPQGCEPTFFEATNALAFAYFRQAEVDIAVIETGLGGRLDSTNVVDPVVSVITSIGWDHQDLLGDTLEAIAAEKAGIIKPHRPVVLGDVSEACAAVIRGKAEASNSEVRYAGNWRSLGVNPDSVTRRVEGAGRQWELGLASHAQMSNAAVVHETIGLLQQQGMQISDEAIAAGFKQTSWPARFQRISRSGFPEIILDGAHNSNALDDLNKTWNEFYNEKPDAIAFGCLRDKLSPEFIKALEQLVSGCQRLVILPVADSRAASESELRAALAGLGQLQIEVGTVAGVIENFSTGVQSNRYLICGSLYLAGEVLAQMRSQAFQPELNG